MPNELTIRQGRREDVAGLYDLICELADFEHARKEVTITMEELLEDGFGAKPRYRSLVAVEHDNVLAMALYYPRYSTWKGKTLYLEDLIVKREKRRKGIGHRLMKALIRQAKDQGYKRLEWQVLDWNDSALEFYENFDVEIDKTWLNCRIAF
ncbi:MAG: GNAT family N-acetyltransferase [Flavobacteriales bacterium]|nr:GNAT family N-acetyltransferase [Flavobacteriales bacterium]NNK80333.1 GNAT family N-acetyltransferase [Flavobacteriales bacterium]